MTQSFCSKHLEALGAYSHIGEISSCRNYGNGHINDTFLVVAGPKKYILQRINTIAFSRPFEVMENICRITEHIKRKAVSCGKDPLRATLTVVRTDADDIMYTDSRGLCWRMYRFIEDTVCKERVEGREDFLRCAEAFGNFQYLMSDFCADDLYESIVDFHNTPKRFENLMRSAEEDKFGRAASVKKEIEFALARKDFAQILQKARENDEIPLRVTHNDTKLNNILFDRGDGCAVCVIDLDTVMPGYAVNDFGDSIRFGANTAAEDEVDLSLVGLDLELFDAYTEGFLRGCKGMLTQRETELLPIGAMMMTFECGMRFLTDYLDGDVYYKTHRKGHNLDRSRNQFALLCDMESKLDRMNAIVDKYKRQTVF